MTWIGALAHARTHHCLVVRAGEERQPVAAPAHDARGAGVAPLLPLQLAEGAFRGDVEDGDGARVVAAGHEAAVGGAEAAGVGEAGYPEVVVLVVVGVRFFGGLENKVDSRLGGGLVTF